MQTAKLNLRPGIFKQGTDYSAAGRWLDCNLMRWEHGVLKTINGWQPQLNAATGAAVKLPYADPATEAARSGIGISDSGETDVYFGSNVAIYNIKPDSTIDNVTPDAFVPQAVIGQQNTGYGLWRYGRGKYGTPRPTSFDSKPVAFSWGFDAWGTWPVACARGTLNQHVYIKSPADAKFVPIVDSPIGANDIVVTDERILMAVGAIGDGRIVSWSDVENYDIWAPAVDNMAGWYRLSGIGRLLAAVKIQNQVLIVGESDAFSAQFIGPPYVYGFSRIGDKCGAVSANAVAVTSTFAMWYGEKEFWLFDGTLRPVPCDMLDWFSQDIDTNMASKTVAFTNSAYNEIWWLYQSVYGTECDSYIVYNYAMQVWYNGRIDRTVALDKVPMPYMLGVDAAGNIFNHEIMNAGYSGALPYVASGPLELDNGERLLGCAYIMPDEEPDGAIDMELTVRDMPKQPPRHAAWFSLLNPTSTTGIMGRDIRMKLQSTSFTKQWELGVMRAVAVAGPTPKR